MLNINLSKKSILFMATVCNVGNIPFAPGTFGTLAGLPLCYLLSRIPWGKAFLLIAFIIFAIYISDNAEKILGTKDPGSIVIDEVAGLLITLLYLPFNLQSVCLGFVFFRIFDIIKPFPIRQVESLFPGGLGIVLDDVIAGLFAHVLLRLFLA